LLVTWLVLYYAEKIQHILKDVVAGIMGKVFVAAIAVEIIASGGQGLYRDGVESFLVKFYFILEFFHIYATPIPAFGTTRAYENRHVYEFLNQTSKIQNYF